jgi:hypothetical protein
MGSKQINEFNISGKVVFVGRPVQISDNSFKRIIEMEVYVKNRYKQEVAFEFVNDNMEKLNLIRENDWVNIDFCLRGRKRIQGDGKARWFTNLEGLSCTKED